MIGSHPMAPHGSVREFASASWMSFADYQQNYRDLHRRILLSRHLPGPVVNGEYAYHLRDADGDGTPDKSNSYSVEDIRSASWDIVMAGGYLVTGFGTTYFAGHRDPGPFDPGAAKNRDWEQQIGHIKLFFTGLPWSRLLPADSLLSSAATRETERQAPPEKGRTGAEVHPPKTTYWAMAIPGELYVLCVRGTRLALKLDLAARTRNYRVRQFAPRTGQFSLLAERDISTPFQYSPPDDRDWVVLLEAR